MLDLSSMTRAGRPDHAGRRGERTGGRSPQHSDVSPFRWLGRAIRAAGLWSALGLAMSAGVADAASPPSSNPVSASTSSAGSMPGAPAADPGNALLLPSARQPALSFPSVKVVSRSVVTYRCEDGHEIGVAYMNTDNQQSFAVIRLDGEHLVMVSSIAGSGVRYIGGRYIWWTKGGGGNLYDQLKGENAPAVAADCKALKP